MHPSQIVPGFGRHEFILRRIHSLLGVMPLAGYLVFHLATNASIVDGLPTYQYRADQIQLLGRSTVLALGWILILGPLLFHGIIGLLIVTRGKRNFWSYPYRENIRYSLERMTGVIAFFFVYWHVFHMQGWFQSDWWLEHVAGPLGGARFDPAHAVTAAAAIQASPVIEFVYVLGTLAVVYHMSNGLWTSGITWGLWTTPHAQRWANVPCLLIGLGLAAIGLAALWAMMTVPVP